MQKGFLVESLKVRNIFSFLVSKHCHHGKGKARGPCVAKFPVSYSNFMITEVKWKLD